MLARLTREPVTTRAHAGGNGMGLLFCQRVLQSAGGSVRVDSTVGAGTTVLLSFERAVEPAPEEGGGPVQDGGAAPAGSRRAGTA